MTVNVVIRADGGPAIGYGHLVRTGALARRLLDRGHDVTYATTTPSSVTEVCPEECDTVSLPRRSDPDAFHSVVDTPDLTVVDSYVVDADYQRRLRDESPLVVISDDERPVAADVVVNGNLYASELSYEVIGQEPEWCLGPEYLLLRADVTRLADRDPPTRDPPERAIVVLGGSDEAELTPTVVRAFDGTDVRVDAVVGPGCSDDQASAVTRAAAETDASVSVVRSPSDLPRRMYEADFAVTTASTTVYELLALETYPIAFPVVDNQERIAAALERRDLGTVLPRRPERRQLSSVIDTVIGVEEPRRLSVGSGIVDGLGGERLVNRLDQVIERL